MRGDPMPPRGYVAAVFVTARAGGDAASVPRVNVSATGIDGDRYAAGEGSFSRWPGEGRGVTFIESEALDAVAREHGLDLGDGRHRRNVVTAGVRLGDLNGRRFRIGTALLRGVRECAPCRYLERLAGAGTFESLKGRGGLRADVIDPGEFAVGDEIIPVGVAGRLP
jgi:MOSC domain-containing protein YiiM